MQGLWHTFIAWIPLGIAITGISFVAYFTVQQSYRQGLNDPQVQMAEDGATFLAKDFSPPAIVGHANSLDISTSLQSWIAVYDDQGSALLSSGLLDGQMPQPPKGVFESARDGRGKGTVTAGQNRLTWQPESNVRQAIVVQRFDGQTNGYVVAGRNMREVERREGRLGETVMLTWLFLVIASFVGKGFARYFS